MLLIVGYRIGVRSINGHGERAVDGEADLIDWPGFGWKMATQLGSFVPLGQIWGYF